MTLGFLSRDCNSSSTIHRGNSGQHPRGTCALLVAGACARPVGVLPLARPLLKKHSAKPAHCSDPCAGSACFCLPCVLRCWHCLASERVPRGVSVPKAAAFEANTRKPRTCTMRYWQPHSQRQDPASAFPTCSIIASPPYVHNRCHIHSAQTNQNSPPTTRRRLHYNNLTDDAKKVIRDANAKRSKPVKIEF